MNENVTRSFSAAANINNTNELSILLIGLFFAILLLIFAYIIMQAYEEIQNGGEMKRFLWTITRVVFMFCILSAILLYN